MRRAALLAVVALAGLAACGKKSKSGLDPAWFGTAPVPPGKLAGLKPQATLAEARPIVGAEVKLDEHGGAVQSVPTGRDDVTASVGFEQGRVGWVLVYVRVKDCEQLLMKAWGEGTVADRPGVRERAWLNPAGEWRAVMPSPPASWCALQLQLYRPATAALFGATPAPPPALARIKLGMTVADAHAIAPELIGAPGDRASRMMYTTGWIGPSDVKAFVEVDDATGKVTKLVLRCDPEVLAVLEHAWGAGRTTTTAADERAWIDPTGAFWIHALIAEDKSFVVIFEAPKPVPPPGGPP